MGTIQIGTKYSTKKFPTIGEYFPTNPSPIQPARSHLLGMILLYYSLYKVQILTISSGSLGDENDHNI